MMKINQIQINYFNQKYDYCYFAHLVTYSNDNNYKYQIVTKYTLGYRNRKGV